jgi:hypothetical protein
MTIVRNAVPAIAAILLAGALAGCTATSHVSATLHLGSVRFAYCEKLTPTKIEVAVAPSNGSKLTYKTVWLASGGPSVQRGAPVDYGVAPSGFVSSKGPLKFSPASSHIDVLFEDIHGANPGSSLQAVFDGSKLVDGKWMNWNGHLVSTPCES